ncbi:hypothetical protein U2F26_13775 [Micromonospora sp. 4G57]|uniref:Lipoprotein n=1 Tax=Micromonospora sicca TaxID=2202420 RepID=A0ABU5JB35_9ACTN|nr:MULTISPECIES: hypothetical protein [unclassified Micromonospora]MDZ5443793.1 hypothetical protein [Micromonospora sp. 4G57]MDZ5489689.1 hypothetical protein [Micromonospora sp. 4G53]
MIRLPRALITVTLFAATLTACSSGNEPAGSPSRTTAAPAASTVAPSTATTEPITDETTIRKLCDNIANLGNEFKYDAAASLAVGKQAERVADPGFSLAGRDLVKAAGAASAAPGPDTNIDIAQAQLAVLDVCGKLYGDGPWS